MGETPKKVPTAEHGPESWGRESELVDYYSGDGAPGDGATSAVPELDTGPRWTDAHAVTAIQAARDAALGSPGPEDTPTDSIHPSRLTSFPHLHGDGAPVAGAVCSPRPEGPPPGLSTLHKLKNARESLPPVDELDDPQLIARKVKPEDRPRKEGYIEVTRGAGVVKIQRPHEQHSRQPPEREEGDIVGLSEASARRLQVKMGKTRANHQPIFSHLTYPDVFSWTGDQLKEDIQTLWKRLQYRFEGLSMVWKIEIKRRKSGSMGPEHYTPPGVDAEDVEGGCQMPHVHILIFKDTPGAWDYSQYVAIREAIAEHWTEIVFSGRDVDALQEMQDQLREEKHDLRAEHREAATRTERIRSRKGTLHYVSKYISKAADGLAHSIGRYWGIYGRKNMPWGVTETVAISHGAACRMMRAVMNAEGLDPSGLPLARTHLCTTSAPWDLWMRQAIAGDDIPPDRLPEWLDYTSPEDQPPEPDLQFMETGGSTFSQWEKYADTKMQHKERWARRAHERFRKWNRSEHRIPAVAGIHNHTHPSTKHLDLWSFS